jgi:hypothetical protein
MQFGAVWSGQVRDVLATATGVLLRSLAGARESWIGWEGFVSGFRVLVGSGGHQPADELRLVDLHHIVAQQLCVVRMLLRRLLARTL